MLRLSVILFFLIVSNYLFAQSMEEVRDSGNYLYGIGKSDTYEKADKQALDDLISQISVTVEGNRTFLQSEENGNYKEHYQSIIKTYSTGSLANAQRLEQERRGVYTVLRFIKKENLTEIFESRKHAILNYAREGLRSEEKLQIGDALRNFYWANILLRSHPEYNSLEFNNSLLKVYLPNKLNEIFSNIQLEVLEDLYKPEEKYAKYTIEFKYKEKPIQSLDYTYKYKNSWSGEMPVNNGLACIEYYGDDAKNNKDISLRIAYMYKDKAFFDKDVQSVFSSDMDIPYFGNCEIKAEFSRIRDKRVNQKVKLDAVEEVATHYEYQIDESLKKILQSIENKTYDVNLNLFTASGYDAFKRLMKYGKAVLLKEKNDLKIARVNNEFLVRSVPMKFSFSGNRDFVEDVVFVYNKDGKISDINFSLSQIAIDDILEKPERFATREERYFLIRFMETYKTAYCLKNIDYIEKIFDDDALIIVGKVLNRTQVKDKAYVSTLSDKEVEYQRYTKSEYVTRLKRVFSNQEFVNVHFEDNNVEKANRDIPIYGIQIAQHYKSSTYADKGYLFLLLDLRDTLNPIVHVRTWQPHKNPDGSIYGLQDFPFHKL